MTLATLPDITVSTELTITDTPPHHALQLWWCTRQGDPDGSTAFSDDAPNDFAAFCTQIATGAYLFYLARDSTGEVVGGMWLHDIVRDTDATPRAGWIGTYVLPAYRGLHTTKAMWVLVRDALQARGVRSVYIASHYANTRAHRVAETHLGFHRVGIFPAFARFGGRPTDCVILCMHWEDIGEAWALAYVRAQHQEVSSPIHADATQAQCILSAQKEVLTID
jgi:RimJ/RimL family protein N-acetyltransferase